MLKTIITKLIKNFINIVSLSRYGMNVLKECKGVLIEINDDFHDQADTCKKILKECGLKFYIRKIQVMRYQIFQTHIIKFGNVNFI